MRLNKDRRRTMNKEDREMELVRELYACLGSLNDQNCTGHELRAKIGTLTKKLKKIQEDMGDTITNFYSCLEELDKSLTGAEEEDE